jgi:hypothetical protein
MTPITVSRMSDSDYTDSDYTDTGYTDTDTASDTATRSASVEELLTPLRDCILDKPHYISGTCGLPASCFSLFYKTIKDGHAARFVHPCAAQESERA